ncbi:MAG: hypothetical protein QXX12_08430, partial [Nanopusillaceae archaeon]
AFVGDKVVIRCICNFYPLGGLEGRLISPSKNGEYSRTYPIYYACRSKFRTYSFSFDANIEGTWRFVINRGISEVVNEYRINVKKPLTQQQCKIECDPIPSEAYIGDKVNITCKCSGCERPIQVYVKPTVTDVIESIFPLGKYTFKIGEGMCSINGTYISTSIDIGKIDGKSNRIDTTINKYSVVILAGNVERENTIRVYKTTRCNIECYNIPPVVFIGDYINITCKCSGCNEPVEIVPIMVTQPPDRGYIYGGANGTCSIDGTEFTVPIRVIAFSEGNSIIKVGVRSSEDFFDEKVRLKTKTKFKENRARSCNIECFVPRNVWQGISTLIICKCSECEDTKLEIFVGGGNPIKIREIECSLEGAVVSSYIGFRSIGSEVILVRAGENQKYYSIYVQPKPRSPQCEIECYVPSTINAYKGDNIRIECVCTWCDNVDIEVYVKGPKSNEYVRDKRKWRGCVSPTIRVTDEGIYEVKIKAGSTEKVYSINIDVLHNVIKPQPRPQCNIECNVPSTARVGDTVRIECRCSGCDDFMSVEITSPSGKKITFEPCIFSNYCTCSTRGPFASRTITLNEQGTWTIKAKAGNTERTYTINVGSQPQPQCNIECTVPSTAHVGDKVNIECTCSGCNEKVVISYSGPDGSTTIREDTCSREGKTISASFTPNTQGTWTIRATVGNVERSGTINVQPQPQCNLECRIPSEAHVGDKVNIECTCSECNETLEILYKNPELSEYRKFKDSECLISGTNVLVSLDLAIEGNWEIKVKAGSSERNYTIKVVKEVWPGLPAEIPIALKRGWNLISNPTDSGISIEDLRNFGCSVRGSFIYYDPETREWKRTTKMLPDDKGYFV